MHLRRRPAAARPRGAAARRADARARLARARHRRALAAARRGGDARARAAHRRRRAARGDARAGRDRAGDLADRRAARRARTTLDAHRLRPERQRRDLPHHAARRQRGAAAARCARRSGRAPAPRCASRPRCSTPAAASRAGRASRFGDGKARERIPARAPLQARPGATSSRSARPTARATVSEVRRALRVRAVPGKLKRRSQAGVDWRRDHRRRHDGSRSRGGPGDTARGQGCRLLGADEAPHHAADRHHDDRLAGAGGRRLARHRRSSSGPCSAMALVSGGSSAINHWYDRDIDALMERTSARPVASGRVAPARRARPRARARGRRRRRCSRSQVHWLAAVWALAGFACYVLVYTVWLKRRTPQNIVIGGAAGAVPPLAAWAAVDGSVSATAVALFADRLPLDAAPLLGARAAARRGLRARGRADAADRARRAGQRAADPRLHAAAAWRVARARRARHARLALRGRRGRARRALHLARASGCCARRTTASRARRTFLYSLLYLALLFVAMGVDSAL